MPEAQVAIIGGSGLYEMEGLANVHEADVETPFGRPSDSIMLGDLEGVRVAFLPRHGLGHRISPTKLPVRANIYALKTLRVQRIISVSAVGSLKEEIKPLDLVIPDQIIDRTRQRESSFFDDGVVAHVAFADPFCPELSGMIHHCAIEAGSEAHKGGTYVVIEGPAFSTRAECNVYRSWAADVIGMTALPEAKLAREAEICYSVLACVTDYDCWREATEAVTVEMVVANLIKGLAVAREVLGRVIPLIPAERSCSCGSALKDSVITSGDHIPAHVRKRMEPIIGEYLK